MKGKRRTASQSLLTSYEFCKFYRNYIKSLSKPEHKRINSTNLIQECVSEFFKCVSNDIIENKAGVVLRRIGYFGVWMSSETSIQTKNYKFIELNEHTGGHQYVLDFFPDVSSNRIMTMWRMDRMFNNTLKNRLSNSLKRGKKYKNIYFILKEYKKNHLKL